MSSLVFVVLAITSVVLGVVSTSPLGPGMPMPQNPMSDMSVDHQCLFICNVCFPEMEDLHTLLDCSNKVCGPMMAGSFSMEKLIWLGRTCRHYDQVEKLWQQQNVY